MTYVPVWYGIRTCDPGGRDESINCKREQGHANVNVIGVPTAPKEDVRVRVRARIIFIRDGNSSCCCCCCLFCGIVILVSLRVCSKCVYLFLEEQY